jgi:hypothetical protein
MAARKKTRKRRSLRGLGYEASVHRTHAQALETQAARELAHVELDVDRGECDAALRSYRSGLLLLGQSEGHKRSAGGYATLDTVRLGEGTKEKLKQAESALEKRCLVPRNRR